MNLFKISFISIILFLSSCGMEKWTPKGISTIKINTNVSPSEINSSNKITVKNLKGESRTYSSSSFNYDAFDEYNFTQNQFRRKSRTLIVSHPNYNPDTIIIGRKLRPGLFTLDLLGAMTLYLSPSMIIDFANGNIWKVKKNDKTQDIILNPKIDIFKRKLEIIYSKTKSYSSFELENILTISFSYLNQYKSEPYISETKKIINEVIIKYFDQLVNEGNLEKLKLWESKMVEPYLTVVKEAKLRCVNLAISDFNVNSELFFRDFENKKIENLNKKQLTILEKLINIKSELNELKFNTKINSKGRELTAAFIFSEIENLIQFKDSTRIQFKNKYNEIKKNIITLEKDFSIEKDEFTIQKTSLDSVFNMMLGFKSFCQNSNSLAGKVEFRQRNDISGGYNNGVLTEKYRKDPNSYFYRTFFDKDSTYITYTFPNNVFLNEDEYCVIKYDFPDETGTYTEKDKKTGKLKLYNVKRDNVYYKYYKISRITNYSYEKNQQIAQENLEKTQNILRNSNSNSVETTLKINNSVTNTGALYQEKITFTLVKGLKSNELYGYDYENLVYQDRNYIFTPRAIYKLDAWDKMISILSTELDEWYDYGDGYKFKGQSIKNLFDRDLKCLPEPAGIYK